MTTQQSPGPDALLPCPFCGKPPETQGSGDGQKGLMIDCITPGCVNPHTSYYDHAAARRVWNRRSPQPGTLAREEVAGIILYGIVNDWENGATTTETYQSAKRLSLQLADRILALTPSHEAGKQDDEYNPTYDNGITFAIVQLAELTGSKDWQMRDGSEDHDTDVRDTIMDVLKCAGLYDDETGEFAKAGTQEPVAYTNEAQLGYVKDPQYAGIPMAMWAKRGKNDVPLYTAPASQDATRELERLRELIARPYIGAWTDEILIEAAHQRERWGADQDQGKAPEDWFWLIGYLAGKALSAHKAGDTQKAHHHTVSTAAVLAHWVAAIDGNENAFRPGIGAEKISALASPARADRAVTADDREKCPVDNPDWNLHRPCPVCGALGPWFENGDCIAPPDATDDSEKDAEIARLRGILEGLAADFDRARDATPFMAEARRLDKCAKYCRTSALPPPDGEKGGA